MNYTILLALVGVVLISGITISVSATLFDDTPKISGQIHMKNQILNSNIHDILVDSDQNLFTNNRDSHTITKYDGAGNVLFKITPNTIHESFYYPEVMVIDSTGNLYVGMDSTVWKFDGEGNLLLKWGTYCELYNKRYNSVAISESCVDPDGDDGPLSVGDGQFADIVGITIDNDDFVYVADVSNHKISKFDGMGNFVSSFGDVGNKDGNLYEPVTLAVDSTGDIIIGTNDGRLQKFDKMGKFSEKLFDNNMAEKKKRIDKVMIGKDDTVYIVDGLNNSFEKFTSNGELKIIHESYGKEKLKIHMNNGQFYVYDDDFTVKIFK